MQSVAQDPEERRLRLNTYLVFAAVNAESEVSHFLGRPDMADIVLNPHKKVKLEVLAKLSWFLRVACAPGQFFTDRLPDPRLKRRKRRHIVESQAEFIFAQVLRMDGSATVSQRGH